MFGLLLAEEAWVHRRVETVSVLSTQFLRRAVSVDFTIPEEFHDALRVGTAEQWFVPLATLAKRPLRNFDLRDEAGAAVPVLGRDHNGPLAYGLLLGVSRRALTASGMGGPSGGLVVDLERVATGDPEGAACAIASIVEAEQSGDGECRRVLQDDASEFLLADLSTNYVLVALCDDLTRRRVMKFRYEEPLTVARRGVFERLGWSPLLVEIDAPGVSRAASYHAEVVIPEELRFEACFLFDKDAGAVYAEDGEADQAALHAARVPLGTRTAILFGLRAERTSFPIVGSAIAWVTGALLLGGALVGDLASVQADSAIAVLLAASAVFAGVVARSGEHRVVQALFAGPRLLVVVSALSALVAAAALAYDVSSTALDIVWKLAAATSLIVALMLTITLKAARPIAPGEKQ